MTAHAYTWRGVSQRGEPLGGMMTLDSAAALCAVVKDRFERGWRELTVFRDAVQVAAIERDVEHPRRRTWWSERD